MGSATALSHVELECLCHGLAVHVLRRLPSGHLLEDADQRFIQGRVARGLHQFHPGGRPRGIHTELNLRTYQPTDARCDVLKHLGLQVLHQGLLAAHEPGVTQCAVQRGVQWTHQVDLIGEQGGWIQEGFAGRGIFRQLQRVEGLHRSLVPGGR